MLTKMGLNCTVVVECLDRGSVPRWDAALSMYNWTTYIQPVQLWPGIPRWMGKLSVNGFERMFRNVKLVNNPIPDAKMLAD
mmetsp:Transcript_3438/g.7704  ORF Transcript_3438/g.7704 Transcript_3438/m.7704 type:complete len:81 (-) Transcript_3438:1018-1260(-)